MSEQGTPPVPPSPFPPAGPPTSPERPATGKGPAPLGWKLYVAMCVFMVLLNVGLVVSGVVLLGMRDWIRAETDEATVQSFVVSSASLIVFGFLFAVLNSVLPFLKKTAVMYVIHAINAVAAAALCIPLPIALPTLIFWFKPETRDYFGFR